MSDKFNASGAYDPVTYEALENTMPAPGEVWSGIDGKLYLILNKHARFSNALMLVDRPSVSSMAVAYDGKLMYTRPEMVTYILERYYNRREGQVDVDAYASILERCCEAIGSVTYTHVIRTAEPVEEPKIERPVSCDPVSHPSHYTYGPVEVIDIIEGFNLEYHLGNVVKYVLRHEHKGNPLQDLKKALWYLKRYIDMKEQKDA